MAKPYKKRSVPVDRFAKYHGPVITKIPKLETDTSRGTRSYPKYDESKNPRHGLVSTLPDPFKCSKCGYVATGTKDSRSHWFDEHRE